MHEGILSPMWISWAQILYSIMRRRRGRAENMSSWRVFIDRRLPRREADNRRHAVYRRDNIVVSDERDGRFTRISRIFIGQAIISLALMIWWYLANHGQLITKAGTSINIQRKQNLSGNIVKSKQPRRAIMLSKLCLSPSWAMIRMMTLITINQ